MSAELPPAKRQRTHETAEDSEGSKITQSSKFWFDDGNVVLQAENKQYRVHRSMLSRHSNVFKDMFSLPQPPNPLEPYVEGCPLIQLTDKAEDLEEVLSLFYDNIRTMRQNMPFHQLASILRLGKKYEIDYLRDEGLKRLRLDFPSTLELWDKSLRGWAHIEPSDTICQDAINLAHELSIQTILPVAYAGFVNTYDTELVISGGPGEDKALLNEVALKNCLIGRDKILLASQDILIDWAKRMDIVPAGDCLTPILCRPERLETIIGLEIFNYALGITILDPFPKMKSQKICAACVESLKKSHNDVREKLWESLPPFFGLPKWEDLKDFDQ